MYIHTCMYKITMNIKEVMNLKESETGYMGGLGGRKLNYNHKYKQTNKTSLNFTLDSYTSPKCVRQRGA